MATCHIPSCLPAGQDKYKHKDAGCHYSAKVSLYASYRYTQNAVKQFTFILMVCLICAWIQREKMNVSVASHLLLKVSF